MNERKRSRAWWLAAIAASLVVGTAALPDEDAGPESFARLAPVVDVLYLLANSSLTFEPDVEGPAEDVTFTGTVAVPKYPVEGFGRRRLPNGRFQIDFELTDSKLRGESYLMGGTVVLGEHPELRSLGTITQAQEARDYPADFLVQRKVLIQTPKGPMHNEEPVPVRGRIDAIPPIRTLPDDRETNVFRGEDLPIALLDQHGEVAGWFNSTVHVAYAVDPVAIYRAQLAGSVEVEVDGHRETIAVQGPVEILEQVAALGEVEVVMMALRGQSDLLGGPIMLSESFAAEEKFSLGRLGFESAFDLHLEIDTPAGPMAVQGPVHAVGRSSPPVRVGTESLGGRGEIPVFDLSVELASGERREIFDPAGRRVGNVARLHLHGKSQTTGRRPCCPPPPRPATGGAAGSR